MWNGSHEGKRYEGAFFVAFLFGRIVGRHRRIVVFMKSELNPEIISKKRV
jgi:hypothetical protein